MYLCEMYLPNGIFSEPDVDDKGIIFRNNSSSKSRGAKSRHTIKRGDITSIMDFTIRDKEHNFRENNYFKDTFNEFQIIEMNELSNINDYLPCAANSVMFTLNNQDMQFETFEAVKHDQNRLSFYPGGPIRASAWCPQVLEDRQEVLALTADYDFDAADLEQSLIQFWIFDSRSPSIQFQGGIGLDRKVNYMKWCPSLSKNNKSEPKLGLLAAACSDGCVRIFTISKEFFKTSSKMSFAKASMVLRKSEDVSIGKRDQFIHNYFLNTITQTYFLIFLPWREIIVI